MKALVIGGNRFFGKRLVSLLLENGAEVTVLNRGRLADDFGNKIHRIKMDRKNLDPNIFKNTHWDIIYDQVCFDAHEAKRAIEIFKGKTKHYVFVSSQSVYESGANIPESQFDPLSHKFEKIVESAADYAEAKRQAEVVFFKVKDFPITAVRFPIVLGEDDYTERLKLHVEHIQNRKAIYFPNINGKLSTIQSIDAAKFLFSLLEKQPVGPINCCAKEPIHLKSMVEKIETIVGKKAILADSSAGGTNSPFGVETDWYMSTEKLNTLGFEATPLKFWLEDLIHFYKKEL